jgi:glutamyl-tRNA synthetase
MRLLAPEEFAGRLVPYLQQAGFVASPEATDAQLELVRAAAPLVQERMQLLGETPDMLGFLFVPANEIEYQDDALKTLKDGAVDVIAATAEALAAVDDWSTAAIEAAMRGKLIDELGHKPRLAFGPARVALSGRRISPPLFESMELLGRDETLARLERLRAHLSA